MSTLTLSTIRSLVRSNLNEASTTMITDAELNAIINDGYVDTSFKGLCYETKITKDNIAAEKIISLRGSYVIKVNYVEYKLGSTEGGRGLLQVLPQVVGYVPVSGSAPQYWFQWGDYLVIEPVPDVATYDLAVYAACYPSTVLSADGDLPLLPPEFHECILEYAMAFSAIKLRRWADFAALYNRYITSVQMRRQEFIKKSPDPRATHDLPDVVEESRED